jgi:hypothetical protein
MSFIDGPSPLPFDGLVLYVEDALSLRQAFSYNSKSWLLSSSVN